jgi:hypothetical protein
MVEVLRMTSNIEIGDFIGLDFDFDLDFSGTADCHSETLPSSSHSSTVTDASRVDGTSPLTISMLP